MSDGMADYLASLERESERLKRRAAEPRATERQCRYLRALGYDRTLDLTRREASRLIARLERKRRRSS